MGRPRYQLKDPNLALGVPEQGFKYGSICIVPVWRVNPLTAKPAFWLAYDENVIEDKVAPQETDEQSMFVSIARSFGCRLAAVPNGGFREIETAVKMKREGMSVGYPDIIINRGVPAGMGAEWEKCKARKISHPLTWEDTFKGAWIQMPVAIEFKKRNGSLGDIKPEQLAWAEELTNSGWRAIVADGCQAALAYMRHLGFYMPPERK